MLAELLATNAFALMLVFSRVGAAVMFLPGVGELAIPARVRLGFALALSLVVMPVVGERLPPPPAQPIALAVLLGGEVLIGVAVGTFARLLISALQTAGTVIAAHAGMSTAMLFDPNAGQQGAIIGAFLATLGVTLLFVTGLHQVVIVGVVDSYVALPPGGPLPVGDLAAMATRVVSLAFKLGLEIAMPVVVVAMLLLVGMGVMSRLMPQVHIFFISLPLQVGGGLLAFALSLAAAMLVFLEVYREELGTMWTR